MIGGVEAQSALDWAPLATGRAGNTDIPAITPESIGVWAFNTSDDPTKDSGMVFHNQEMFYLQGEKVKSQSWYQDPAFEWHGDNQWAYSPEKKWISSTPYKFLAYAPYSSETANAATAYDDPQTLTLYHVPRAGAADYIISSKIHAYTSIESDGSTTFDSWQTLYMQHILSRLRFCFMLGSKYVDLRTIHLKSMDIDNDEGNLFTVTVNYEDDGSGAYLPTLSWVPEATSGTLSHTLLTEPEVEDYVVLSKENTEYQPFASCYVYPGQELQTIKVTVTYDVFDMDGQLLRQNDTASNTLWLGLSAENSIAERVLTPGYYYDVNIAIQPSFLYVLSDNDPGADGAIVIQP